MTRPLFDDRVPGAWIENELLYPQLVDRGLSPIIDRDGNIRVKCVSTSTILSDEEVGTELIEHLRRHVEFLMTSFTDGLERYLESLPRRLPLSRAMLDVMGISISPIPPRLREFVERNVDYALAASQDGQLDIVGEGYTQLVDPRSLAKWLGEIESTIDPDGTRIPNYQVFVPHLLALAYRRLFERNPELCGKPRSSVVTYPEINKRNLVDLVCEAHGRDKKCAKARNAANNRIRRACGRGDLTRTDHETFLHDEKMKIFLQSSQKNEKPAVRDEVEELEEHLRVD